MQFCFERGEAPLQDFPRVSVCVLCVCARVCVCLHNQQRGFAVREIEIWEVSFRDVVHVWDQRGCAEHSAAQVWRFYDVGLRWDPESNL